MKLDNERTRFYELIFFLDFVLITGDQDFCQKKEQNSCLFLRNAISLFIKSLILMFHCSFWLQ